MPVRAAPISWNEETIKIVIAFIGYSAWFVLILTEVGLMIYASKTSLVFIIDAALAVGSQFLFLYLFSAHLLSPLKIVVKIAFVFASCYWAVLRWGYDFGVAKLHNPSRNVIIIATNNARS